MSNLYNESLGSTGKNARTEFEGLQETSFVNKGGQRQPESLHRLREESTNPNLTQRINYGVHKKKNVGKRFLVAAVLVLLGSLGTLAYINREKINAYLNSIVAASTYDTDYFENQAENGIQSEEDKPLGRN